MSSPNTHCRQPNLATIQEISPYHIISAPQDNGPQRQIYWNSTTQTTQHSVINRKLNSQAETVYNVLSEFGSCSSAGMLGTFISPCNTAQDPPIKETKLRGTTRNSRINQHNRSQQLPLRRDNTASTSKAQKNNFKNTAAAATPDQAMKLELKARTHKIDYELIASIAKELQHHNDKTPLKPHWSGHPSKYS